MFRSGHTKRLPGPSEKCILGRGHHGIAFPDCSALWGSNRVEGSSRFLGCQVRQNRTERLCVQYHVHKASFMALVWAMTKVPAFCETDELTTLLAVISVKFPTTKKFSYHKPASHLSRSTFVIGSTISQTTSQRFCIISMIL